MNGFAARLGKAVCDKVGSVARSLPAKYLALQMPIQNKEVADWIFFCKDLAESIKLLFIAEGNMILVSRCLCEGSKCYMIGLGTKSFHFFTVIIFA